jgi:hypothetical protein
VSPLNAFERSDYERIHFHSFGLWQQFQLGRRHVPAVRALFCCFSFSCRFLRPTLLNFPYAFTEFFSPWRHRATRNAWKFNQSRSWFRHS